MTDRGLFMVAACAAVMWAVGSPVASGVEAGRRPNVLFIVVDDLNNRLGCYGYDVATPNIDWLATMGRRFDRAYCQYPVCNPSRASVMSGWRPEKTGVLSNTERPRPHIAQAPPLQEYFRANGYFTARVGKIYHSPFEKEFQWDVSENSPAQKANFGRRQRGSKHPRQVRPEEERRRAREPARRRRGGEARPSGGTASTRPSGRAQSQGQAGGAIDHPANPMTWVISDQPDENEPDGFIGRRVARLIEEKRDGPFFIAAGFHKPHQPWIAPRRYFEMYPPQRMTFPAEPPGHLGNIPDIAFSSAMGRGLPDEERRRNIAAYYACVSFIDAQVGIILDTLSRLGELEDTVIIFWGDHGFQLGEHGGLWGKAALFEESARVPLIIAAPGLSKRGTPTTALVELVDLYPTLVELCGLPSREGLDGMSLVPLLKDPDRKIKTAAFTDVRRGPSLGRSIRTDRHRYTEWPNGRTELYEYGDNPDEYRNLARDLSRDKLVAELEERLHAGPQAAATPTLRPIR